jgi:hypothetical protein
MYKDITNIEHCIKAKFKYDKQVVQGIFMFKIYYYTNQFKKALFLLTVMLLLKSFNLFSQTNGTTNRVDTVLFTDFLSNSNKFDTISIDYKLEFFNFFKLLKCLSGAVYFSGDGFPSAMVIQCKENEARLKICFERCVSGSKFTLDNCAFFRDGGLKPIVINKVVLFQ